MAKRFAMTSLIGRWFVERGKSLRYPARMQPSLGQLWARYRAVNADAPMEAPAAFHFCDNAEDANLCLALVLAGVKRATATSLAEVRLARAALPQPGEFFLVTDWAGEARAVIRTISVEIRRFSEVDEEFARLEGEGDGTLAWWREAHLAYYRRVLAGSGHVVDGDLEIACERFERVFPA
ncbi:uncharacterized protein YhfF [Ancylobacter aquaticus]|uniref:Uncharacterized protein YhfF n=1 Tax=Ancylobacter aquaticus TaxID=100 RepID=A0A4R1HP04_ANCAQ|nr:ASCH domain-containing protein [Ancylobacter aquaticus]TCK23818.1 uncharacterized protein YhfF [Ancylobacter aquaticus]